MKKYELYTASKERFRNQQETQGFINWEQYHDNFKLECWNMLNPLTGNVEPTIIQFWQNGNGYSIYRESKQSNLKEWLDSQEFYELLYSYRTCDQVNQDEVVKRFEAIKETILNKVK